MYSCSSCSWVNLNCFMWIDVVSLHSPWCRKRHVISSQLNFLPLPHAAPSPPRMLTTTAEPTGSIVELNWLHPLHPNGVIHYEIEYQPARTPGDPVNAGNSSSPYFTLTLPSDLLTYNVRVAAVNTQGRTRSNTLFVIVLSGIETGMYNCICVHIIYVFLLHATTYTAYSIDWVVHWRLCHSEHLKYQCHTAKPSTRLSV